MVVNGAFSSSSGPILLDSVDCWGNESRLEQCFNRSSLGDHNCRGSTGHAGVLCPGLLPLLCHTMYICMCIMVYKRDYWMYVLRIGCIISYMSFLTVFASLVQNKNSEDKMISTEPSQSSVFKNSLDQYKKCSKCVFASAYSYRQVV